MNEVTEWLISTIKGIVSKPDEVKVDVKTDDMGVLFTVKVNPEDNGRIIGREGASAKAIRTLLRTCGMNHQIRASMRVDTPDRPDYRGQGRNC